MAQLTDALRALLRERHYASLSTLNANGSMHVVPIWYLFDGERFFIESASTSRKVRNILARPQASLMIDVRKPGSERWVCASGHAAILRDARARELNDAILRRYLSATAIADPRIGPVFAAVDDVTIELTPDAWQAWDMKAIDDQYFGGVLAATPEKWFLPMA